jgi:hypothetical protein
LFSVAHLLAVGQFKERKEEEEEEEPTQAQTSHGGVLCPASAHLRLATARPDRRTGIPHPAVERQPTT